MKTIKTIRTQLTCLCLAGAGAISLASCDWDRREATFQRENQADSLGQPDDRFRMEDAEAARERAQFEENMHQTATTYAKQMQDLKSAAAKLPGQQQEARRVVAGLERKLTEFEEQIAKTEKAEGMRWADYRKILPGSSPDIKGHLNRAEESVDPAEAGSQ